MKIQSTLKHSPTLRGGFLAYDSNGELIATISKMVKADSDAVNGKYRICWVGGAPHGKISYATDTDHLADLVSDCAASFHNIAKMKAVKEANTAGDDFPKIKRSYTYRTTTAIHSL